VKNEDGKESLGRSKGQIGKPQNELVKKGEGGEGDASYYGKFIKSKQLRKYKTN
jgi:hypothetical protein